MKLLIKNAVDSKCYTVNSNDQTKSNQIRGSSRILNSMKRREKIDHRCQQVKLGGR